MKRAADKLENASNSRPTRGLFTGDFALWSESRELREKRQDEAQAIRVQRMKRLMKIAKSRGLEDIEFALRSARYQQALRDALYEECVEQDLNALRQGRALPDACSLYDTAST